MSSIVWLTTTRRHSKSKYKGLFSKQLCFFTLCIGAAPQRHCPTELPLISVKSVTGLFAVGLFAVEHFAVRHLVVRTLRRKLFFHNTPNRCWLLFSLGRNLCYTVVPLVYKVSNRNLIVQFHCFSSYRNYTNKGYPTFHGHQTRYLTVDINYVAATPTHDFFARKHFAHAHFIPYSTLQHACSWSKFLCYFICFFKTTLEKTCKASLNCKH